MLTRILYNLTITTRSMQAQSLIPCAVVNNLPNNIMLKRFDGKVAAPPSNTSLQIGIAYNIFENSSSSSSGDLVQYGPFVVPALTAPVMTSTISSPTGQSTTLYLVKSPNSALMGVSAPSSLLAIGPLAKKQATFANNIPYYKGQAVGIFLLNSNTSFVPLSKRVVSLESTLASNVPVFDPIYVALYVGGPSPAPKYVTGPLFLASSVDSVPLYNYPYVAGSSSQGTLNVAISGSLNDISIVVYNFVESVSGPAAGTCTTYDSEYMTVTVCYKK